MVRRIDSAFTFLVTVLLFPFILVTFLVLYLLNVNINEETIEDWR